MKIELKVEKNDFLFLILAGFCAAYTEEDARYYGLPGNRRRTHQGFDLPGLELIRAEEEGFDLPGLPEGVIGVAWTTSANNRFEIEYAPCEGVFYVRYRGRRHALRLGWVEILRYAHRKGSVVSYETAEPTWAPWQTADDQPAIA